MEQLIFLENYDQEFYFEVDPIYHNNLKFFQFSSIGGYQVGYQIYDAGEYLKLTHLIQDKVQRKFDVVIDLDPVPKLEVSDNSLGSNYPTSPISNNSKFSASKIASYSQKLKKIKNKFSSSKNNKKLIKDDSLHFSKSATENHTRGRKQNSNFDFERIRRSQSSGRTPMNRHEKFIATTLPGRSSVEIIRNISSITQVADLRPINLKNIDQNLNANSIQDQTRQNYYEILDFDQFRQLQSTPIKSKPLTYNQAFQNLSNSGLPFNSNSDVYESASLKRLRNKPKIATKPLKLPNNILNAGRKENEMQPTTFKTPTSPKSPKYYQPQNISTEILLNKSILQTKVKLKKNSLYSNHTNNFYERQNQNQRSRPIYELNDMYEMSAENPIKNQNKSLPELPMKNINDKNSVSNSAPNVPLRSPMTKSAIHSTSLGGSNASNISSSNNSKFNEFLNNFENQSKLSQRPSKINGLQINSKNQPPSPRKLVEYDTPFESPRSDFGVIANNNNVSMKTKNTFGKQDHNVQTQQNQWNLALAEIRKFRKDSSDSE